MSSVWESVRTAQVNVLIGDHGAGKREIMHAWALKTGGAIIRNAGDGMSPLRAQALVSVLLGSPSEKPVMLSTYSPSLLDGINLLDDRVRLFSVSRDSRGAVRVRRIPFGQNLMRLSEAYMRGFLTPFGRRLQ